LEDLEPKFRALKAFAEEMRKEIIEYEKYPASSLILDEVRYQQLIDLGFEAPSTIKKTNIKRKRANYQEYDDIFPLLQEYKSKYDSCVFPQCKEKQQNLEEKFLPLKSFIRRMQAQLVVYRKNPASSWLDEDKYNQLMDLGFPVPRRTTTK
jgi:hypothetical protein